MSASDNDFVAGSTRAPGAGRAGGSSIGAALVSSGRLSLADAEKVLRFQHEKKLRFGEAAVQLGLVTQADIDLALSSQFDYPYLIAGQSDVSPEVSAAYAPFAPQTEILRSLRTQLMLRRFDAAPGNNTLAIVSAERGEGRSYIAANLAVVFAQLGQNTLLIDADLRNPRQHRLFGVDDRVGLSALLSGRAGPEAILGVPHLPNLSLLPAGVRPPNPAELLARPLFPRLLEQVSDAFDVVLFDSPAWMDTADAQIIAVRAGAAVIVAKRNSARSWRVQGISAQAMEARASIVGAVLNDY